MTKEKEFFIISQVSREDLNSQGFDGNSLDDAEMQNLADRMGSSWCDTGYWETLDATAEYYEIKKLNNE